MNSNDETYNGWANRETWAVALHINNDQGWQESVLDAIREDIATDADELWNSTRALRVEHEARAGRIVRENVEEAFDLFANGYTDNYETAFGIVQDIGSLWRVDWTELGRSFLEDLEGEDMPSSS